MSSSIPSWQILTAHAQPFRGARDLAFCLKVSLDSLLVWASSGGSGETARMRRLAWTFAVRIGDKYQIRLTRSIYKFTESHSGGNGSMYCSIFFSTEQQSCYAPVICKHGPGDIDFSLAVAKPRYMPSTVGTFFMFKALPKALLKSWQVNVKLPRPVWAWNQKPRSSTVGTLMSKHGTSRGILSLDAPYLLCKILFTFLGEL